MSWLDADPPRGSYDPTGPVPVTPGSDDPTAPVPAVSAPPPPLGPGAGGGGDGPILLDPATPGDGGDDDTPRSVFGLPDLVSEMTQALTARPARTLLTALGTILGVAALVTTLGLAKTAGNQIVSRFDELEATEVVVTPREAGFGADQTARLGAIPWDAEDRIGRLNGVSAVGTRSAVDIGDRLARSVPVIDPLGQTEFQIPVVAVSPGLFDAVRAELLTGRTFDAGHEERGDPVAILGPAAAQRLNVTRVDNIPTVFVGDESFSVIGILSDVARQADLLSAIIIPTSVAQDRFGLQAVDEVQIEVDVGAAELIGSQAALALSPNDPEGLKVAVPPSPTRVRSDVENDVNALFLILGAVSLLVGAIGIANVTLVSVLERTGEIGLRRALGATRFHIAVQFVAESVALGALAGLLGASVGVLAVVVVSATREWTPVLDAWLPFAAPVLGAVIGLIAGTYPAWKAASTEPITALRGGA